MCWNFFDLFAEFVGATKTNVNESGNTHSFTQFEIPEGCKVHPHALLQSAVSWCMVASPNLVCKS